MKFRTRTKILSYLRLDKNGDSDMRAIDYLSDLRTIFEEMVVLPEHTLTLTFIINKNGRKNVALYVSYTSPVSLDDNSVDFLNYFEERLEPYLSFESTELAPEEWGQLFSDYRYSYDIVPVSSEYDFLNQNIHIRLNPLQDFIKKALILNLETAVSVTLTSLSISKKKELLQLLPVIGAKHKMEAGSGKLLPTTMDWGNGVGELSLTKKFNSILEYSINVLSTSALNPLSRKIIKSGFLGDYRDKFQLKRARLDQSVSKRSGKQSDRKQVCSVKDLLNARSKKDLHLQCLNSDGKSGQQNSPYIHLLDASNAAKVFQIPLAVNSEPFGINIRNMPLQNYGVETSGTNDIVVGKSIDSNRNEVVSISAESLTKHCYILGKTGSGKSNLMLNMIKGIAESGNQAVFLLDPHGDLAQDVVRQLSPHELKRTVYIDFASDNTPGINPLDTDESGLDFVISELEQYFLRLWGPDMFGPRIQDAFRNFLTLLSLSGGRSGTLCDLLWAINLNEGGILSHFKDIAEKSGRFGLRLFLDHILAQKFGDGSFEHMVCYFRAKFSAFTDSKLRHNFGQNETTLPFQNFVEEKKIVILNLNKGQLSARHSNLLGTILTAMLFQTSIQSASKLSEEQRSPLSIFIDEFHNFISPSIADILAEARKFKISLILANQHLGQLAGNDTSFYSKSNLQEAILGNVGSLIAFQSSHQDSIILADEIGQAVDPTHITSLPKFSAIARLEKDNQPVGGTLFKTMYSTPKRDCIEKVKQSSEELYCRARVDVDKEINMKIKEQLGWTDVPENVVDDFFNL